MCIRDRTFWNQNLTCISRNLSTKTPSSKSYLRPCVETVRNDCCLVSNLLRSQWPCSADCAELVLYFLAFWLRSQDVQRHYVSLAKKIARTPANVLLLQSRLLPWQKPWTRLGCLRRQTIVIVCHCLKNKFWLLDWLIDWPELRQLRKQDHLSAGSYVVGHAELLLSSRTLKGGHNPLQNPLGYDAFCQRGTEPP